jgi:hypothetical protein
MSKQILSAIASGALAFKHIPCRFIPEIGGNVDANPPIHLRNKANFHCVVVFVTVILVGVWDVLSQAGHSGKG